MTNNFYTSLLGPSIPLLAESKKSYNLLTEKHIQAIWLEQKYFNTLKTSTGDSIHVISPGIWNAEAGPDFLKAHIKVGNQELRGDIEIHLTDESWRHHHHQCNPAYDNVILHLSFWRPRYEKEIMTHTGTLIRRTYLEESLTIPLSRILQLLDLDLYPYKKFVGSGRCAHTLFRTLPESRAIALFEDAAQWRLEQKRSYLKARIEGPSLQLCAGIAMALGYKNNTETFLELFIDLLKYSTCQEQELLALGMGAFGFFNSKYQNKWSSSTFFCQLKNDYERMPHVLIRPRELVTNKVRPLNHPIRRLVYLTKLLSDSQFPHLFAKMADHWKSHWSKLDHSLPNSTLKKQLHDLIPCYQDPYWNHHYTFEAEERKEFLPLIGDDLKQLILINTFLPLLQEEILKERNPQEMDAFNNFYRSFPALHSSKSKYLAHRFFGETPKANILHKAIIEQGAFQLHRDFCIHYEASCEGCPFVERFQKSELQRLSLAKK